MRILVVEDQQETARVLKELLEAERYAVDIERDGERGLYRVRTNDYDLILLDSMLPGKGGPEVCQEIRSYKMSTPILILSARTEIEQKVSLLNCGADDYLTKPYSYTELSARVKALLRRPSKLEAQQLTVGDLILDRATYSALRGERRIPLTPKEFSLLEYMMKNAGRVVTRGMILEHVWSEETSDLFSNAIETHVANLRRKIDRGRRRKTIRTVSGQGYVLRNPKR